MALGQRIRDSTGASRALKLSEHATSDLGEHARRGGSPVNHLPKQGPFVGDDVDHEVDVGAVDVVDDGKAGVGVDGHAAAAAQLGLKEAQLYAWRTKTRQSMNTGAREQQLADENVRLKRQLAEQAEELALVKKAAAYFAKHLK